VTALQRNVGYYSDLACSTACLLALNSEEARASVSLIVSATYGCHISAPVSEKEAAGEIKCPIYD